MTADLLFDAQNIVGESLVWDDRARRLVWVDIIGRKIHRLDPQNLAHESWDMPDIVTSVGLRKDGGAIVGLGKEVALWDFGGPLRTLCAVEAGTPNTRLNEGVVAPDGCFWVGTMANNIGPDDEPVDITEDLGRLWRVDPSGAVSSLGGDRFGITNTFVWLNGDRFVTADTMKNALYLYRWDQARSRIEGRRDFFPGFERGLPDGSCIDAEGFVWNCRVVGGSCVARIAPDGSLDCVVELPCSWPTSCAFGGDALDTLYVTSARFTMSAGHLAANPQEGGLFAVKPGVQGIPTNRFG
jgi:sugar lactone lactonase YvrE